MPLDSVSGGAIPPHRRTLADVVLRLHASDLRLAIVAGLILGLLITAALAAVDLLVFPSVHRSVNYASLPSIASYTAEVTLASVGLATLLLWTQAAPGGVHDKQWLRSLLVPALALLIVVWRGAESDYSPRLVTRCAVIFALIAIASARLAHSRRQ